MPVSHNGTSRPISRESDLRTSGRVIRARQEVAGLAVESLQQREEHWVIADMIGKGGHVRTVPVPTWVKAAVDNWMTAAGVTVGAMFRPINKAQRMGSSGLGPKVIWGVVKAGCSKCGLENVAPHDLRRYAPVCVMKPAVSLSRSSFCSAT